MKTIPIEKISFELSPVVRASINQDIVAEYAESYREGKELPAPEVFVDDDGIVRLADGRHRVEAAMLLKLESIKCEVHSGGYVEALKHAAGSNSEHGLRRTNADKRVCIVALLKEFPSLSDRKLAEIAMVDHKTVASVRADMALRVPSGEIPTNKNQSVGTKSVKEKKRMGAKSCGDVHYATPEPQPKESPPPPQAAARSPMVPPMILELINDIVRETNRLQHCSKSKFLDDPAFCHLVSQVLKLQKLVQPPLPGMEEYLAKTAPAVVNKTRCTAVEASDFCLDNGLPAADGAAFFYHMESQGWRTKGGPVKDWRATILKWKAYGYMASQKRQSNGHGVPPAKPKGWASKEIDAELARLRAGK